MKSWQYILTFVCFFSFDLPAAEVIGNEKLVIAHRGASGYLPEHTLEAKVLAHAMGADFIEQDVVMTKDDALIVLHDLYLDRVSNVAEKFPSRKRQDGRFYVIDFTLTEIRSLSASEGFSVKNSEKLAIYPERFPLDKSRFSIHTLAEEIELIQGLNNTTGKNVGLYPEIKSPAFHLAEGKDISKAVLTTLKQYGYKTKTSNVFVQSSDPNELERIKYELLASLGMELKLVQLIAMTEWQETFEYDGKQKKAYDYDWMQQPQAMEKIAKYADGIGPWKPMLISVDGANRTVESRGIVEAAHMAGLVVHPYTFRADKGRVPDYVDNFEELLRLFYFDIGVDGVFTDFPDKAVLLLNKFSKIR